MRRILWRIEGRQGWASCSMIGFGFGRLQLSISMLSVALATQNDQGTSSSPACFALDSTIGANRSDLWRRQRDRCATLRVWRIACGRGSRARVRRYSSLLFQLVGRLTAKVVGSSQGQDRYTRATSLGDVPRSSSLVGGSNVLEEGEPRQCSLPKR